MRQDLLQGVKGNFEVSRALARPEQEHLSAYGLEALQRPFRLDGQLEVIVQRRSQHPHRYVVSLGLLILACRHHLREQREQPGMGICSAENLSSDGRGKGLTVMATQRADAHPW